MINEDEIATVARQFAVPESQVRRDHLISHALVALADFATADKVTFLLTS